MRISTATDLGNTQKWSFYLSVVADWHDVPAGAQVSFALSEEWGIFKGPPPSSMVFGDASPTHEYLDVARSKLSFRAEIQRSGPY